MATHDVGDRVRCTGTFTDANGTATDPNTVTFKFRKPTGLITSYVYGVDGEVVKSGTGVYYVDLNVDTAGRWWYRFEGLDSSSNLQGAEEVEFFAEGPRSGMVNLIARLRALSNAGTAQYTVGQDTYWSDQHLQDTLDRHSTWIVDSPLTWVSQNIGGTAQYFTALSSYRDLEETDSGTARWQVRQTDGTAEGTANYSVDYTNGRLTWSANQAGTVSYVLTGYSYDLHAAAVEVLRHKLAYVDLWYDFEADNQSFSRSQVVKNLQSLIAEHQQQAGGNLPGASGDVRYSTFVRNDLNLNW